MQDAFAIRLRSSSVAERTNEEKTEDEERMWNEAFLVMAEALDQMADLNLNEDALLNTDKKCEDDNAQAHKQDDDEERHHQRHKRRPERHRMIEEDTRRLRRQSEEQHRRR